MTFPDAAWKTIGLVPFCWGGNRSARRSAAAWLSVPGSRRLSLVFEPYTWTTTTRAAATASQPPRTSQLCLAASQPMRYSTLPTGLGRPL